MDEFYRQSIMAIGWDELGDFSKYESRSSVITALKQAHDNNNSYMNISLAIWQFVQDVEVGDIIFAKRGKWALIGRGIVESGYIFDSTRNEYKNTRKVRWTHKGEWEHPGNAHVKTLTDVTPYTEYVEKIETLILGDSAELEIDDAPESLYPVYSEADFLNEVYISRAKYDTLRGLVLRKKNVILQGAPGVGKTFVAQRLAFAIMGEKDTSRVKRIQFHQSYSYEDFIMGYRPDAVGFRLVEGPFYKFCKHAEKDEERPYFFIIDEINRVILARSLVNYWC